MKMVKAWKETVVIPTYEAGVPEKAPMFLEKRVYQGSSGTVYPYPVIEKIADEKTDKAYNAVFIENEYIKVMILPELGGRVQMAYDKIAKRHFVYYNQVIKPALVGLAGPWISGGIEFNWPQHHRPSTFMPVDCTIEKHTDGAITVWVSEIEQMSHQKGMAGFTLRPGVARLEINGVLYNRTDVPQTFLWWANPAVAVNDHYQSVFPPDINAVFDHGKRAVSSFPIATGTYYKMDYSAGVDISNYKNIKVPTSYMGINSKYDFEGGYENDTRAGMLHVASHHISPGKKQWTWGNGDFGRAWDRNLTDSDGPYIELMAGVYTENQPDFSWLQPYEEKRFVQYFFPYRELGIVKNASRDFVMNIEPAEEGFVNLKIFATATHKAAILLTAAGNTLHEEQIEVSPENIVQRHIHIGTAQWNDLKIEIICNGKTALAWEPEPDEVRPVPEAAEAALSPEDIKTCDQLYLTGLHLEQYRHATFRPTDYYEEALRRDPKDVRCNNALGLWHLRKGCFEKAESYLRKAVRELQRRNPNPYDGEAIYNLALALRYQGRHDEAYGYFAKACWNAAWQDAGYFNCAQIAFMNGRTEEALEDINRALIRNWHNHKARALKAEILRSMGNHKDALKLIEESLQTDKFNFGALWVKQAITGDKADLTHFIDLMRDHAHNYDETALDFTAAGAYDLAAELWTLAEKRNAVTPMTYYYKAWCLHCGKLANETETLARAAASDPSWCFPNRREAVVALRHAMAANPSDGMARYYLGNLYYDARLPELSTALWEEASRLVPGYPLVWRNLALAYFNKAHKESKAVECMEKAMSLNENDPRMLMELDQLYRRLGHRHEERLAGLRRHSQLIGCRDDLLLEEITLLNILGRYEEARTKLDTHIFHPWEGGEGKVSLQYQYSRVELAKENLANAKPDIAIRLLRECLEYPANLGEGKLNGAQENDFYYLLGLAYEQLGDLTAAKQNWELAVHGPSEPAPALYYNDAKPDKIFYQGMALQKLGREAEARGRFHKLLRFGEKHLFDQVRMDYFAVSLPDLLIWEDDLGKRNVIHCRYMMALGCYGLGHAERTARELDTVLSLDPNHQGAMSFKSFVSLDKKEKPCKAYSVS